MTSFNRFKVALVSLVVGLTLTFGASRPANAQTAGTVEEAFRPFVAPSLMIQQQLPVTTVEQRLCGESGGASRSPELVVMIQSPQVLTPLNVNSYADNPYFAEGLYRWITGELARTTTFARPMTSMELLSLVRRTFTPQYVLQRLCAHASGVCRPMFLWRATFLRDPWCEAVDRGEIPFPSARSVVAASLEGSVCLDDSTPGVRSSYLPCPMPNRVGFVRVFSRSLYGGRLLLPSGEIVANNTREALRFGGNNPFGATVWGGGGTVERPLALDEYLPTNNDGEDELDQYDESSSRRRAVQRQSSFPVDEDQW